MSRPAVPLMGLVRTLSALADSIGFGNLFPYMGNIDPFACAKDGGVRADLSGQM